MMMFSDIATCAFARSSASANCHASSETRSRLAPSCASTYDTVHSRLKHDSMSQQIRMDHSLDT